MPYVVVQDNPSGTQELYDTVIQRLGFDQPNADLPNGLIHHAAGPADNGGWVIISEWESKADFEEFRDSRLRHVIQQAGMNVPIQPRTFEVYREFGSDMEAMQTSRAA